MANNLSKNPLTTKYPNLLFWFAYLTLNSLLFLPLYLLNLDSTTFLPLSALAANNPAETGKQLLVWRNNLDIFRLNAEILLLLTLWVYLPWLRRSPAHRLFRWFFGLVYVSALSYAIYESVMLSTYQSDPVFYSHFHLALDGLPMLVQHVQVPLSLYLLAGLGFVVGVIVIGTLIRTLIGGVPVERLSWGSKGSLALMACLVILAVVAQQETLASPKMEVSSFTYKLHQNIIASVALHERINAYDDAAIQNTYNYADYKLLRKPKIYLIFVESYGSVLYKRPDYLQAYSELLDELQIHLQENNWHVVSALSEAPTWGAGSWMSLHQYPVWYAHRHPSSISVFAGKIPVRHLS
jgi:hypothetical protein